MFRLHQPVRLVLAVVWAFSASAAARAQVFPHPARPDPAVQQEAQKAQQAILRSPNQFGTYCCQILQIPAASFNPIDTGIAGYTSLGFATGYVTLNGGAIAAEVWATVTLPSGAALDYLDLYYYDNDPANGICVDLWALTGTGSPSTSTVATTCSSGNPGYAYAANFASGTISNDVAFGGGAQYVVVVYDFVPSTDLEFKAVDIWWHRQVSPAPGTATFNDVPTNHPFFQFVEALVASGITVGCQASPPLYCPDAPLTRKQMAAFLAKGYGLYWPF